MSERRKLVVERTYRASVQEIWDLWTTKEGFESWWGPEGFRVEVHEMDARVGGTLRYDMIAATPEMVAEMERMGQPDRHRTRGTFSAITSLQRLVLTHVIDFLPGVPPYKSKITVELFDERGRVRMVVTLHGMHSPEFSQMQQEGFTSQLTKLDKRFG